MGPPYNFSLAQKDLLVPDDWGRAPLSDEQRRDFLEIVEDRYDRRSTLTISQLPVERWRETIGDPTLADAILDRLIHNAHTINPRPRWRFRQECVKINKTSIVDPEIWTV